MSKPRRFLNLVGVFCCIFFCALAAARAQGGAFEKIKSVKFFIVDFSEAGSACGLSKAALQEAFMAPAREQGLAVTDSSPYWIFVRATTLIYSEKSCITHVDAAVLVNTRYFNPATLQDRSGRVELWSKGNLLVSDIKVHSVVVNNAFREMGRDFLTQWQRDQ